MSTVEEKRLNRIGNKGKDMTKRSNVCFNCSGLVPQVGPAQTVVVAICLTCKPKYMKAFNYHINQGKNWKEARLDTLSSIIEEGPL